MYKACIIAFYNCFLANKKAGTSYYKTFNK